MTPDELNQRFPTSSVQFKPGANGMSQCQIKNDFAEAEIYLHGAHVTHFQPHGSDPILWMSSEAVFDPSKAIRGGIPICWPWFGQHSSESEFPQHGFARISEWKVRAVLEGDSGTDILLGLTQSEDNAKYLPGTFDARYRISIGQTLTVELSVTNTCDHDLTDLGCALHTYFSTSSIDNVEIEGLVGQKYLDQLTGEHHVEDDAIRFNEEFDRVYYGSVEEIKLIDKNRRSFGIQSKGSESTVIWNPWIDKSKRMGDFPDDGYQTMVCIEAANAYDDVRTIGPGETHSVSQTISTYQH